MNAFKVSVCCIDLWDLLNGLNVLIRHKESIQKTWPDWKMREQNQVIWWVALWTEYFQASHFLMTLSYNKSRSAVWLWLKIVEVKRDAAVHCKLPLCSLGSSPKASFLEFHWCSVSHMMDTVAQLKALLRWATWIWHWVNYVKGLPKSSKTGNSSAENQLLKFMIFGKRQVHITRTEAFTKALLLGHKWHA